VRSVDEEAEMGCGSSREVDEEDDDDGTSPVFRPYARTLEPLRFEAAMRPHHARVGQKGTRVSFGGMGVALCGPVSPIDADTHVRVIALKLISGGCYVGMAPPTTDLHGRLDDINGRGVCLGHNGDAWVDGICQRASDDVYAGFGGEGFENEQGEYEDNQQPLLEWRPGGIDEQSGRMRAECIVTAGGEERCRFNVPADYTCFVVGGWPGTVVGIDTRRTKAEQRRAEVRERKREEARAKGEVDLSRSMHATSSIWTDAQDGGGGRWRSRPVWVTIPGFADASPRYNVVEREFRGNSMEMEGGERDVMEGWLLAEDDVNTALSPNARRWIFKFPKASAIEGTTEKAYCEASAMLHGKGQRYAALYNSVMPKHMQLTVVPAAMVSFKANGVERFCLAEPMLEPPAHFVKYNRNDGSMRDVDDVPDPVGGGRSFDEDDWRFSWAVAQAFSHFSCAVSGGTEIILDLQGVGRAFTDLAVATSERTQSRERAQTPEEEAANAARRTDLGQEAIDDFMTVHHATRCKDNPVCQELKRRLPSFDFCRPCREQEHVKALNA
jgi:hypothetical protein